ncbi:MAG: hypothetical protein II322_02945 [Alistipes sp.]|nr:hypothetical protein [Alistipes sp.]
MVIILEHNYPTTVVDDIVTKHLRVQLSDGELHDNAVQCVRNAFDVASDYCNRIIAQSLVSMTVEVENGVALLPTAPIIEVMSVQVDGKDVEYRLVGNDKATYITNLPATATQVEVSAEVGYADGELPGAIYAAVAIIASSFFESGMEAEFSARAKSLLNPYRIYPYGL